MPSQRAANNCWKFPSPSFGRGCKRANAADSLAFDGLSHRHHSVIVSDPSAKSFRRHRSAPRKCVCKHGPSIRDLGSCSRGNARKDRPCLRAVARLARHNPNAVFLDDPNHRGQLNAALFPVEQFPICHGRILCRMRRECRKMSCQGAFGPFTPECFCPSWLQP